MAHGRGNKPSGDGFARAATGPGHRPRSRERARMQARRGLGCADNRSTKRGAARFKRPIETGADGPDRRAAMRPRTLVKGREGMRMPDAARCRHRGSHVSAFAAPLGFGKRRPLVPRALRAGTAVARAGISESGENGEQRRPLPFEGHVASAAGSAVASGSGGAGTAAGAAGSGSSPPGRSISRAASALAWAATVPTPPRSV